jgi:iron complex outermembrane receptor protein
MTIVHGQLPYSNDTIKIKEVVITGKTTRSDPPGYKKITLDSSILANYSHSSLSDVLSENTGIYIKSYGMGASATPSFRGTGASHTQIAWNGININHPMLGQSDLALLPAGLIDDIQVYYGGASMQLNSGGIGGIINLETRPVWNRETNVSLNSGIGSFGSYSGLLTMKSGNDSFQSVTKAFFHSAKNDFRYLNDQSSSVPVWETRKNSQTSQQGFIQEIYYRQSENIASARIWYQSADRNLASSMLTRQTGSGETQSDESLRIMLSYDINKSISKYSITGAWLAARLNYSNPLASIDSRNASDLLNLKASMERSISSTTKIRLLFNEELTEVNSNNYEQTEKRNTASLTASADYRGADWFGASFLVREILDNNKILIPDFSAATQLSLGKTGAHFLKANVSRNSKIPTMNDLYWVPGGNPELKNEYAFIYELTYEMVHKTLTPADFSYELSVFRNSIKDMIQWRPGLYSVWTAANIQNVITSGLESSFSVNYKSGDLTTDLKAAYSFTKAIDKNSTESNSGSGGKQLMYIPVNQLNLSLRFSYRNFYSSVLTNMTGKRYITADNSRYLPGYCTNNVIAGVKLTLKQILLDLNFEIENLFDVTYQNIAYYPLPGRAYTLKLLIQFSK